LGNLKASGKAEIVVAGLPSGGSHSTRNLVFTPDNRRMLVSVGSRSNDAEGIGSSIGAGLNQNVMVSLAGHRQCEAVASAGCMVLATVVRRADETEHGRS
jgi:glucose/arabinose dehydrogenase